MKISKNKKAIIIGGGIHGITAGIALAAQGIEVKILDKNEDILQGTSGATHNRAHLGYHYPRSVETARECSQGLEYFSKQYPQAVFNLPESYYAIAKANSKTSTENFIRFCQELELPYENKWPAPDFLERKSIESSFLVPEPVFNIDVLKDLLKKQMQDKRICLKLRSEVVGFTRESGSEYRIKANEDGRQFDYPADIVINATYAFANNVLKIFDLKQEMTPYTIQETEVAVVKAKKFIPGLAIIDGPFITVLPYAGHKNTYLVYDVRHSIIREKKDFYCYDSKECNSNWKKMIEHGLEYFPFMRELEYMYSLWAYRPIPVKISNDCRTTRIKAHSDAPGVYSIFEGKFISAPLIAGELVKMILERDLV